VKAKLELEALILAGSKLSNFAFNVAQEKGRIPVRWCDSARDVVSEFDNALRAYRVATKPEKRALKRKTKAAKR
jgi:hypothetical protein